MHAPRHILITGASGGIGSALARLYAVPGCVLGLLGRDSARLRRTAEECALRGARAECLIADVTDAAAMRDRLCTFDRDYPIDLLIANAGISSGRLPSGEHETHAAAENVLKVNMIGTLNTVAPVVDPMRARKRGQIALMGSLAARPGLPWAPSYSASKAAVETYGAGLRGALARDGISVSVISPGFVRSPMSDRVEGPRPFLIDADKAARIIRRGLASRRARIAFPLPLALAAHFAASLPPAWTDRLLRLAAFRVRPS